MGAQVSARAAIAFMGTRKTITAAPSEGREKMKEEGLGEGGQ